jgi:alpha-tubulin suppressor-like RCC1 family protein
MDCRYFDYGQILDNYRVCAKCKRRASNHNLLNQIISSTTINLDLSIMIQNYLKPKFISVAAGHSYSIALKSDGTVCAWGLDDHSQTKVPNHIQGKVIQISAGWIHATALTSTNLVLWGYYDRVINVSNIKQISSGETHNLILQDNKVVEVGGIPCLTIPNIIQNRVIFVQASYFYSIALLDNHHIHIWGYTLCGQADIPDRVQGKIVSVYGGRECVIAILDDGEVVGWGQCSYGQTTIPTHIQKKTIQISCGAYHVAALLSDHTVVVWGSDIYGQTTVPSTIQNHVIQISCGGYHTMALLDNGDIVCWGSDEFKQLNFVEDK